MKPAISRKLFKWELIAIVIALVLMFWFLSGCALLSNPVTPPAERVLEDWADARQDGQIDAAEAKAIDRDMDHLQAGVDSAKRPFPLPTPGGGIPWLGIIEWLGGIGAATGVAHKTVNWSRDRRRKKRGEPTGTEKLA